MNNNDLKIRGSGTISNGEYKQIDIAGSGKITGDVIAEGINAAGSLKSTGDIKALKISVAGSFKTTGSIIADNISSTGSTIIEGQLEAKLIRFAGYAHVYKNINAEKLKVAGTIKSDTDINSKNIELKVNGSKIVNLKGENILIDGAKRKLFFKKKGKINNIELIEGKNIDINNCKVKKVIGENVIIGNHCIIDLVEYSDTLEISKKSKVKENVKNW